MCLVYYHVVCSIKCNAKNLKNIRLEKSAGLQVHCVFTAIGLMLLYSWWRRGMGTQNIELQTFKFRNNKKSTIELSGKKNLGPETVNWQTNWKHYLLITFGWGRYLWTQVNIFVFCVNFKKPVGHKYGWNMKRKKGFFLVLISIILKLSLNLIMHQSFNWSIGKICSDAYHTTDTGSVSDSVSIFTCAESTSKGHWSLTLEIFWQSIEHDYIKI